MGPCALRGSLWMGASIPRKVSISRQEVPTLPHESSCSVILSILCGVGSSFFCCVSLKSDLDCSFASSQSTTTKYESSNRTLTLFDGCICVCSVFLFYRLATQPREKWMPTEGITVRWSWAPITTQTMLKACKLFLLPMVPIFLKSLKVRTCHKRSKIWMTRYLRIKNIRTRGGFLDSRGGHSWFLRHWRRC